MNKSILRFKKYNRNISSSYKNVITVKYISIKSYDINLKFNGITGVKKARMNKTNEKNKYNYILGYNSKYNQVNKIFRGL